MIITGLENNYYLFNNDIIAVINNVLLPNEQRNVYADLKAVNQQNGRAITMRYYFYNGNLTINIAPIIKALTDAPKTDFIYNLQDKTSLLPNYSLSFIRYGYRTNNNTIQALSEVTINRYFIRGGKNEQGTNFNLQIGTKLRNSDTLPYWQGYPTSEFTLQNGSILEVTDISKIDNKELLPLKDNNGYYLKFLNQKEGYSYWLFYGISNELNSSNIGFYQFGNDIKDFGSEITTNGVLTARMPIKYVGLMLDLIVSSDVYLLRDNKWVKIILGKNKIDQSTSQDVVNIDLRFNEVNNFNPSI